MSKIISIFFKDSKSLVRCIVLTICLLMLLILPDIYMLNAHTELGWKWMLGSILVAMPICCVILFGPFLWLQILLTTLLALISIIEICSAFTYYNYINAISFPAFMYANGSELDDMMYYITHFVLKHEILPIILYTTIISLLILNYKYSKNTYTSFRTICFAISIFVICVLTIGFDKIYAHSPYHMPREIATAIKLEKDKKNNTNKVLDFTYKAKLNNLEAKIIVVAIGESLNYSHCSFGHQYHRQTTPQISIVSNMIFYTDYFATATYTEQSVPMLLTRATPIEFNINYKETPIQSAFKEVGYSTYVISNKNQIMNNGVDGYLLKGADSVVFVDTDREIINKLAQLTQTISDDIFILLHFSGNHFFYGNYPKHYNKWTPNYNYDKDICSDSLFINAYDNSILYTDSLLNACITNLEKVNTESIFLFISDHGEYIDSHVGGHGLSCNPAKDEYHVPLMVWYSDEYAAAYPSKVANMIKHKDEPVCGDHVFWSVLDMAGIEIDSTLQQEGMSIFGDSLRPHQRTLLLPDGKTIMKL